MTGATAGEGFRPSPQQVRCAQQEGADSSWPRRALCLYELSGEMDPEALKNALIRVQQAWELLRTTIVSRPEGGFQQWIAEVGELQFETIEPMAAEDGAARFESRKGRILFVKFIKFII